jgi:ribonuclease BN (tRNA processing enzyme)
MCQEVGQAMALALSRRGLLSAGAGLGGAALGLVLGGPVRAAPAPLRETGHATRLVLLGTAGGPAWMPGSTRRGIASAVCMDDAAYLVDCGYGASERLFTALTDGQARAPFQALEPLRALLFTHLHSDHVVDYPALLLQGWTAGLGRRRPVQVHGPGPRGALPPVFALPGAPAAEPAVVAARSPAPGLREMTERLFEAFATDINDRMRDYLWPDLRELVALHEIALPPIAGFRGPNETPAPEMAPFEVFADARVRVSATLVDHFPVFPAFAFRVETPEGSVVFSGDTAPCENLVRLAQGTDVLVHEVIDDAWVAQLFPPPRTPAEEALEHHLLAAHTRIEDAGRVAARAGAKTLVLNHVIPHHLAPERAQRAARHYDGRLVLGEDLAQIGIGRARR